MFHSNVSPGANHIIHQWVYADATARLAATGFGDEDVGKVALQTDTGHFWALSDYSPITWIDLSAGGGVGAVTSVFGRTGVVVAAASDYDASQVDNDSGVTGATVADALDTLDGAAPNAHAASHNSGGSDAMAIDAAAGTGSLRTLGTGATAACAGNDARLSDARTPTSHAVSHKHGGSDEVATATPAANAIPKADGSGKLALGWLPVFGQNYQTAISLARSTTTSATFQTKATLTTPALTGTYRVGWHAVVDQSSIADDVEAQLYNVTDSVVVGVAQKHEISDSGNRIAVGGFAEVVFTGAAKTFQIQYRQQRGSTAGIQDARIEIWRVS